MNSMLIFELKEISVSACMNMCVYKDGKTLKMGQIQVC